MNAEDKLSRWSRLKHEQRRLEQEKAQAKAAPVPAKADEAPPALPPVDSLTAESDFSAFMHPKVQDTVRRVALKKLFSDAHFNTPDPFEPFSGDWTVGETIAPDLLKRLNQAQTHAFSGEERVKLEAEDLERDHAEALAMDAQRTAAKETKESDPDEPGRQDA